VCGFDEAAELSRPDDVDPLPKVAGLDEERADPAPGEGSREAVRIGAEAGRVDVDPCSQARVGRQRRRFGAVDRARSGEPDGAEAGHCCNSQPHARHGFTLPLLRTRIETGVPLPCLRLWVWRGCTVVASSRST
jgi:hypothetical protein